MRLSGPMVTLGVGAALGAVLLALSMSATNDARTAADVPAATVTAARTTPALTATSAPAPTPTATPSPSAAASRPAARAFAARVDGGGPFVAMSIRGTDVIAYLCDGSTLEAWLWGKLDGDELILRGNPKAAKQALLAARLAKGRATGAVLLGQERWTFSAPRAVKPSGLYRATAPERGAKVVAGWVVLANGRQVGMSSTNGATLVPAPKLDTGDGSATIGGTDVTAVADPAEPPAWVVR